MNYLFLVLLIVPIYVCIIVGLFVLYDTTITRIRLKEAQKEWDEYSKDLTYWERQRVFPDWIVERKWKKGYMIIPNMMNIEPTVFQTEIDGVKYRGSKEEISKKSGISLDVLDSFAILPLKIKTKQ